ncbi:MAG: 5-(carboxyamino)imidazole ribonucleotide synthase [Saprospiraceae bacterium]
MQKIGILGGGQLGKMLCIAAAPLDIPVYILDEHEDMPAAHLCQKFVAGDFNNYDDVYAFGKQVDILTIEIEHVNTGALLQLQKEGKIIHPAPDKLSIIKDKGLQKMHFVEHELPSSAFSFFETVDEIESAILAGRLSYPFVQKLRTGGYDGKGVEVIKTAKDLSKLMEGLSIVEEMVDIEKELAVIACRNENGEISCFPAVEMEFHQTANLVEFLACPAQISGIIEAEAEELAAKTIESFGICGLLAVELFLTKDNRLLINEVAPRPHNSGHHTIDSCYTSQFQQHLRGILNLPLGSTRMKSPSIMINLLGEEGFTGDVKYEGMAEALAMEGVNIHLYGKTTTKPFRKMGHLTVVADTLEDARKKAESAKKVLKVVS